MAPLRKPRWPGARNLNASRAVCPWWYPCDPSGIVASPRCGSALVGLCGRRPSYYFAGIQRTVWAKIRLRNPTGKWDELEGLRRGNQLDSLGVIHRLQDLFASLNHWLRPTKSQVPSRGVKNPDCLSLEQLCPGRQYKRVKVPLILVFSVNANHESVAYKPRTWTEAVDAVTTAESMRTRYGSQPWNVSNAFTPQDAGFWSIIVPSTLVKPNTFGLDDSVLMRDHVPADKLEAKWMAGWQWPRWIITELITWPAISEVGSLERWTVTH